MLDGCRCRVYSERPKHCREFDCLLLKSVRAKRVTTGAALQLVRLAQDRAEKVGRLLRRLGETDEQSALADRFRRTARRLEKLGLDQETSEAYGQLTLAFHELNLLLSESFYPFPGE